MRWFFIGWFLLNSMIFTLLPLFEQRSIDSELAYCSGRLEQYQQMSASKDEGAVSLGQSLKNSVFALSQRHSSMVASGLQTSAVIMGMLFLCAAVLMATSTCRWVHRFALALLVFGWILAVGSRVEKERNRRSDLQAYQEVHRSLSATTGHTMFLPGFAVTAKDTRVGDIAWSAVELSILLLFVFVGPQRPRGQEQPT